MGPRDDNLGVSYICGQFVASISDLAIGQAAARLGCLAGLGWHYLSGCEEPAHIARTARTAGLHTAGWPAASPRLVQTEQRQPGQSTHLADFRTFPLVSRRLSEARYTVPYVVILYCQTS